MAEGAATELAALEAPAGLEVELHKTAGVATRAGHHHLRAAGAGGDGEQQRVVARARHHQAVAGGQIAAANAHRVPIGIDVAAADAGEVEGGQQRVHRRRTTLADGEAGAGGADLLVDVELGALPLADRGGHQHEAALVELTGLEQGLGGTGGGERRREQGPAETNAGQGGPGERQGAGGDRGGHRFVRRSVPIVWSQSGPHRQLWPNPRAGRPDWRQLRPGG